MSTKKPKTFLKRDKRERLVYVVVLLWIFMGILSAHYQTNFEITAVYYVSLTGFVGAYIWGESVRKSGSTPIGFVGRNSRRELMIYISIILWFASGIWGIVNGKDLLSISAYFSALTPFVSAYILGQSYKPTDPTPPRQDNPTPDNQNFDTST